MQSCLSQGDKEKQRRGDASECKTSDLETGCGFSAMGVVRADESGSSWETRCTAGRPSQPSKTLIMLSQHGPHPVIIQCMRAHIFH